MTFNLLPIGTVVSTRNDPQTNYVVIGFNAIKDENVVGANFSIHYTIDDGKGNNYLAQAGELDMNLLPPGIKFYTLTIPDTD